MPKVRTLPTRVPAQGNRLATMEPGSWRGAATTAGRGYGGAWQRARKGWLAKHPLCVACKAQGRVVEATDVDHIVPHRGDMHLFWDSENNWQSLCGDCHKAKTARGE